MSWHSPFPLPEEKELETTLRPRRFEEFVGQKGVVSNLRVYVEAARKQRKALDHVLLSGPPGLGKTTLAHLIAQELGVDIVATSGPVLERPADLAGILTRLKERDVLFIDEIHRLPRVVEEYLYGAMEDFVLDVMLDRGPHARAIRLHLQPFTLVGATTRPGMLTGALRSRFGILEHLEYYMDEEIRDIVVRSARILGVEITPEGALEIARRSRGTPRIANRLLRRTHDFALVEGDGVITGDLARYALDRMGVDPRGLDALDQRFLKTLVEQFGGGPAGIRALSATLGEDPQTLEEVVEPFLLRIGFLVRTPRGRKITARGLRYLGLSTAPDLFGG